MNLPRLASPSLQSRQWLVIALVLAWSAVLGARATPVVLVLAVVVGGLLLLLLRPHLGVALIPVTAMSVGYALGTGTESRINAPLLLIAALLAVWPLRMFVSRRVALAPSRLNAPLIAFVVVVALSFIAGNLPWNYFADRAGLPAQLGGLAIMLLSALTVLLVGNIVTTIRWLKIPVLLFIVLGLLVLLGRFVPVVRDVTALFVLDDPSGSTGSLFWVWLAALCGGLGLFNRDLRFTLRVGLVICALAVFAAGWFLLRSWVAGWLPPLVVLGTLLWLKAQRATTILGGALIFIAFVREDSIVREVLLLDQYSTNTRLLAWQIILAQVVPASPVLGLGPANYYFYTPLYPILGYYVRFNSHSQYVDLIAQTGLLGLLAFGWLMVFIARLGWSLRRRVTGGFASAYVHACLAGLTGSLAAGFLADWFLPFVYNIGLAGFRASILGWFFLGGLITLEVLTRDTQSSA